jgi:hypothetical protein
MRKVAICLFAICLALSCATPIYAKHHVNPEARAAQKRNKARQKAMKKDIKAKQKAARSSNSKHQPI